MVIAVIAGSKAKSNGEFVTSAKDLKPRMAETLLGLASRTDSAQAIEEMRRAPGPTL